jgi:hypothetical protein
LRKSAPPVTGIAATEPAAEKTRGTATTTVTAKARPEVPEIATITIMKKRPKKALEVRARAATDMSGLPMQTFRALSGARVVALSSTPRALS